MLQACQFPDEFVVQGLDWSTPEQWSEPMRQQAVTLVAIEVSTHLLSPDREARQADWNALVTRASRGLRLSVRQVEQAVLEAFGKAQSLASCLGSARGDARTAIAMRGATAG